MRTRWLGLGLGVVVLLLGAAPMEEPKVQYVATIGVDEAEVRSGAGSTAQMYPTGRLKRGDRVEVVREMEGGWLAIRPPAGSFSWVNSRFVKETSPGRWVVIAHPDVQVPLLLGSSLKTDKPTVEGVRVQRGTILKGIGPMKLADDGYWLPVEPTPREVRYIRADAVARKPAETTTAAPPGPPGVTPGGPPQGFANPGTPPSPPSAVAGQPGDADAMWQRAQQAEKTGQYNEAIQLYREVGNKTANSNHAMSVQAFNRAQWISDALQGRPGSQNPQVSPSPGTRPANWVNSGAGWLRRAGRNDGLSVLYVLENSQGMPIVYAIPMSGHSLQPYENQYVDLIGVRQYRNDLRAYHMTVMQVQPLR